MCPQLRAKLAQRGRHMDLPSVHTSNTYVDELYQRYQRPILNTTYIYQRISASAAVFVCRFIVPSCSCMQGKRLGAALAVCM